MLRRILYEAIRSVLSEQTTIQRVNKNASNRAYQQALRANFDYVCYKYGRDSLDFDANACDLLAIILDTLDATATDTTVGVYTDWLVKYMPAMVDAFENQTYTEIDVREAIRWFHENKKKLPYIGESANIWDYSVDEIMSMEGRLDSKLVKATLNNQLKKYEGQFKIVADTPYWSIVEVFTWDADRFFGSKTSWCTVANKKRFDEYADSYFIVIPKDENGVLELHSPDRLQFHAQYDLEFDEERGVYIATTSDSVYTDVNKVTNDPQLIQCINQIVEQRLSAAKKRSEEKVRRQTERMLEVCKPLLNFKNVEEEDGRLLIFTSENEYYMLSVDYHSNFCITKVVNNGIGDENFGSYGSFENSLDELEYLVSVAVKHEYKGRMVATKRSLEFIPDELSAPVTSSYI